MAPYAPELAHLQMLCSNTWQHKDMQACQRTILPVRFAGKAWGLQQPLDLKLDSSVPIVHEHDCLVGGLITQAGSQADCTAREDSLGVWLLLLMQKGVACHLHQGK